MDCNKTTNFFSELKRLCDSRTWCEAGTENKEQCPLFDVCVWRLGIVCNEDVKGQSKFCKNGATNTRRKHTRRTFWRSSRMHQNVNRLITAGVPVRAGREYTAESVRR